jgi:hypothetical protein
VVAALTPIVRRLDGDAAAAREFLGTLGEIRRKSQPMTPRSDEDSGFEGAPSEVTPSLPPEPEATATVAEPPRRDRRPLVYAGAALLGLTIAGIVGLGLHAGARTPAPTVLPSVVAAPTPPSTGMVGVPTGEPSAPAPPPPRPSPPVTASPPAAPPRTRHTVAPARKPPPKKPRKREASPSDLFDPYQR